jgi:hypothetical protein
VERLNVGLVCLILHVSSTWMSIVLKIWEVFCHILLNMFSMPWAYTFSFNAFDSQVGSFNGVTEFLLCSIHISSLFSYVLILFVCYIYLSSGHEFLFSSCSGQLERLSINFFLFEQRSFLFIYLFWQYMGLTKTLLSGRHILY